MTDSCSELILAVMTCLLVCVIYFCKPREKVTRRLLSCEIWSAFNNLARPLANNLEGWLKAVFICLSAGRLVPTSLLRHWTPGISFASKGQLLHKVKSSEDWIFFLLKYKIKSLLGKPLGFWLRWHICLTTRRQGKSSIIRSSLDPLLNSHLTESLL